MNMKAVLFTIAAFVMAAAWMLFCGRKWGLFRKLHEKSIARLPGNAVQFAPEHQNRLPDSLITGKRILFLGSSVTYGASACGVSFAEYITARNGCEVIKEAVSGTTLVDNGPNSYISRLKGLKPAGKIDLFVCQLSTNDATQKKPLGEIAKGLKKEAFDTKTIAGAIEYIIAYAKESYNCPVAFYTNPRYDSCEYGEMVSLLVKIARKWDIRLIDMWNDGAFNSISAQQRSVYMADAIHPTQAGYLEWWTPLFERALQEQFL